MGNVRRTAWNIYCDESCHLELDKQTHMVMGALACPTNRAREIAGALRAIKVKHGVHSKLELKWTKVSQARQLMYTDYLDVFLNERELRFRAVVIQKNLLDHRLHDQTHDEFYYKMYFLLLAHMSLPSNSEHYIYLDIKDTRSEQKIRALRGDRIAPAMARAELSGTWSPRVAGSSSASQTFVAAKDWRGSKSLSSPLRILE